MRLWEKVKLGEVLTPSKNTVTVEAVNDYPMIGIRLWGEGAYARETVNGLETQYKFFYKAQTGDLTFNKIWARNGAVTILPQTLEGYFVSPEFPVYHVDKNFALPDWLFFLTKCKFFWDACTEKAFGTSGKNRIKPSNFLNIEIPLPPLAEQRRIVSKLKAVQEKIAKVKQLRAEQGKLVGKLLFSKYTEVIEGARWEEMGELAPLVRREVKIVETDSYPELGVRSFGKGTFHKPALSGIEVGTKTIYKIAAGDLVFSNVFAWEGAIAVATKADDGRYGSHRFITCVTNEEESLPEFLCYHFLTEKGMEDINAASPGGAGRNKTLGLKKLEKIKVPVPPIEQQQEFLALKTKLERFGEVRAKQMAELEGVFGGMLGRVFG